LKIVRELVFKQNKCLCLFLDTLTLQCKVSADWYAAIDNLKFTYRHMWEEELFSDCVIKV